MFDDARIQTEVHGGLINVAVPPIDLGAIRRRMNARRLQAPAGLRHARIAIVAAAVTIGIALITAAGSPALVQGARERYIAALHAAGIGLGTHEPVPRAILRRVINPARVTFAQAEQQAGFTVVAPTGLPRDVVRAEIFIAPLAVWSKQRGAWGIDGEQVTFAYTRSGGRAFDIVAVRYSSLSLPAPRYMYDVDDVPRDGRLNLQYRRENFVWRNGDEALHAVASAAISPHEIDRIRAAMHGVPLPRYDNPLKKPGMKRTELYTIPR